MNKFQFLKCFSGRIVSLTNLLTNGNFTSTSGWSHNGASFSVASNVAQFVANSQYDAVYRSDVSITNGHIYYVCETAKAPSASTSFYLTDGTSVVASSGFLTVGEYAFISVRGTATHTSSSGRMHVMGDNRSSGFNTIYAKYASVIDLTACFGEGREPSQSEMDTIMAGFSNNWLNGTQSIFWGA